jgi:hypothetical protein
MSLSISATELVVLPESVSPPPGHCLGAVVDGKAIACAADCPAFRAADPSGHTCVCGHLIIRHKRMWEAVVFTAGAAFVPPAGPCCGLAANGKVLGPCDVLGRSSTASAALLHPERRQQPGRRRSLRAFAAEAGATTSQEGDKRIPSHLSSHREDSKTCTATLKGGVDERGTTMELLIHSPIHGSLCVLAVLRFLTHASHGASIGPPSQQ